MGNLRQYSPLFLIVIFLSLVGILANRISEYYTLEYYLEAPLKGNYLFAPLKGIKSVVGDYFWLKADDYYHGGVSEIARKCRGLQEHREHIADIGLKVENAKGKPHHLDFIHRINSAIMVNEHIHLTGEEAKEMLPWFRLTTLLSPHNVEAYVDGAFWLGRKFTKPKEAVEFLEEGMRNNPDDYRIYREFGFLYCYEGDYKGAIEFLNKSIPLWKTPDDPNDNERASIYDFLGYLYEKTGDYPEAIDNYKKFLEIFPDEQKVKDKIRKINQHYSRSDVSR